MQQCLSIRMNRVYIKTMLFVGQSCSDLSYTVVHDVIFEFLKAKDKYYFQYITCWLVSVSVRGP